MTLLTLLRKSSPFYRYSPETSPSNLNTIANGSPASEVQGVPFASQDCSHPSTSASTTRQTSCPSSPRISEARKACLEAYARMTPTQRYLMKEHQLHRNRSRRVGHSEEEHLEWEFRSRQRTSNMPQINYPQRPRFTKFVKGEEEQRVNSTNKGTRISLIEGCEESEKSRHLNSWELYETVWSEICSLRSDTSNASLSFRHLPWPIMDIFITIPIACAIGDNVIDAAFSAESISSFLFSSYHSNEKSERRRLHEALLRYHPDRFEHRILHLVVEKERVAAKQAARRITDVLNSLLGDTC